MNKTLKVKLFTSSQTLGGIHDYKDFVKRNPKINIVSVNLTKNDFVLLTYYADGDIYF